MLRAERLPVIRVVTLLFVLGTLTVASHKATADESADFFESKVRPLLLEHCSSCHGPDSQEAGLRLDEGAAAYRGGDSGPVIVPGKPDLSRLIEVVRGDDPNLVMPPDERLSRQDIDTLVLWVKHGAIWPGVDRDLMLKRRNDGPLFTEQQQSFWAFQPVTPPPVPALDDEWIESPIDAFILARLQENGLRPSPRADRHTLLRRVTYDLTGLPPTPEEIEQFITDQSPDAWEKVVDRLLSSPACGEKWGRYWLDVARFAESAGHDGNNGYLYAWRYRDYVIEAFNSDLPYNEFIVEQLAGDLLPASGDATTDLRRQIATGFLQVGPKPVVMRDKQQMLLDIADEQLSTTGVAFLGLTLGCARCHDHKFDPIPTADYYSLAGIFLSTHVMHDMAPDSMWLERQIDGPDGEPLRVMTVQDQEQPADTRIHVRGNYRTLGDEVPRRFLQIIAGEDHSPPDFSGSGRLELAQWIADASNPLTARVLVNRIWQQHFGRGIVASTGDFGVRGDRPTHPALLDWLAHDFIRNGWSIKTLHRQILLSATWQQTSDADVNAADPDNHLLSRMPRRRLTAEEIRDSLLAISGEMDWQSGGASFTSGYSFNRKEVGLSTVDIGAADQYAPFQLPRRSVYLPMLRNQMHPMLALFDMANEHIPVTEREESTVATQSLFLMNSPFVQRQAEMLAAETNFFGRDSRIAVLWVRVLGRPASPQQLQFAREFLDRYQSENHGEVSAVMLETLAWKSLCQALFCLNEFIYLD